MVIKALTSQPAVTKQPVEPGSEDIMFTGTFEQVNRFFYENEWSDGLPIIPPTIEKVREFLKFTESNAPLSYVVEVSWDDYSRYSGHLVPTAG
jgi:hypothetical protein